MKILLKKQENIVKKQENIVKKQENRYCLK